MRKAVVITATLREAAHLGKHLDSFTLTTELVVVGSGR